MNSKKTHGWIVADKSMNYWVKYTVAEALQNKPPICVYTAMYAPVSKAKVFATRKEARANKVAWERVKKVRVVNGKAVEIIPGR